MDFIRDFGGLFGLTIAANMAGLAGAQLVAKKAVSSFFMLPICAAAGLAILYYVSADHTEMMTALATVLFAVSFLAGWGVRKR